MNEEMKNLLDKIKEGGALTADEVKLLNTYPGFEAAIQATEEEGDLKLQGQIERMVLGAVEKHVTPLLQKLPAERSVDVAGAGATLDTQALPVDKASRTAAAHKKYSDMLRAMAIQKIDPLKAQEIMKSMTIGSSPDGGYLVPTELMTEIVRFIGEYGTARRLARVVPIGVGSIQLNTRDSGMTAYYTAYNNSGTIAGEQTDITVSNPTYSQVALVAATLATLSDPISNELLQDANVDMFNEIAIEAAEAFAIKEDGTVFNGDATQTNAGGFTGVLQHASVNDVTLAGAIEQVTYEILNKAIYAIASQRLVGARWFMHRTVAEIVYNIKDGENRPLMRESQIPGQPSTLLGYPIELAEAMPTAGTIVSGEAFMFLGNLNAVTIYDRQQVNVQMFDSGTVDSVNLLTANALAVRHTLRHMVVVRRPQALVRIKIAA